MCPNCHAALSFEMLLSDPLTRLVMASDGVTPHQLAAVLETAREAVAARELAALGHAAASRSGPAPRHG